MNKSPQTVESSTGQAPGGTAGGIAAAPPAVLNVTVRDIVSILAAGLRDFRTAPLYGLAVSAIYTAGGGCWSCCCCGSTCPTSCIRWPPVSR